MTKAKPIQPLLRWLGGKRKMAAKLISMMPPHRIYIEPFIGAGAVLLAKPPVLHEVINDADGDLINLYRVTKAHPHELARQYRSMLNSVAIFEECLDRMHRPYCTDIQRAAAWWYVINNNFGGKPGDVSFGRHRIGRCHAVSTQSLIKRIAAVHKRLQQVTIEQDDWLHVVKYYDHRDAFFYLDPPYYNQTGYKKAFPQEQYERMAAWVKQAKGSVIITLNDDPVVRSLFDGLTIESSTEYRSLDMGNKNKQAACLIIRNF